MNYKSRCKICKLMKKDVIWQFSLRVGCKSCADEFFNKLMGRFGYKKGDEK